MWISNRELLRHIKDEVDFILSQTASKSFEEVINDPVLCRAILRSLEIIGEASKKVDPDFRSEHPEIEWKKLAGTRDKLIHDYFGVDYEIVWDIIMNKLPYLQESITAILIDPNNAEP